MNTKRVTRLESAGILFLFTLSILACKDDSLSDLEQLANSYKAVVFVLPGLGDEPIDVLAKGGSLTARLSSDFKVEGRVVIPANIGTSDPATDTNYVGTFTMNADTIRFKNTGTQLDRSDYFPFIIRGSRLESADRISRGPLKIVLERQ
jgi:hypothetical protein